MKVSKASILLLVVAASAMARPQFGGTSVDAVFRDNSSSLVNVAAAVVLAKVLGVDVNLVLNDSRSYGIPVYEQGPVWYIAHECHRPVPTVWELRRRGMGWGEIAHQMGIHPGTFNKMRKRGEFDRFWPAMASNCGVSGTSWDGYRRRGVSDRDIIVAVGVSGGNGRNIDHVISKRRSSGYWDVPGRGKVKASSATAPHGKGHATSNGKSGESHGKGASGSKSHGNGHGTVGKTKGGGKGKGVGGGKTKGGSHGNGKGNGGGKGKGGAI